MRRLHPHDTPLGTLLHAAASHLLAHRAARLEPMAARREAFNSGAEMLGEVRHAGRIANRRLPLGIGAETDRGAEDSVKRPRATGTGGAAERR